VAPVAKLEQQRSRRYKSWYQNKVSKTIFNKSTPDPWNTAAITPGTSFMSQLNRAVSSHFDATSFSKYNVSNIIVSGSDIVGEGEHKIFEYIRNEPEKHSNEHTIIYGLDADLIMLSINHLAICPNIYLFRETPQFIQSIDSSLEPNENYYLNIPELTNSIIKYMTNDAEDISYNKITKVYDYIFMGFFLGNDFMPHFPAINIRTGGVDKLLNAYKAVIGESDQCLTDGKNIYWGNVRKLVNHLSALEEEYIIKEHKYRNNKEKHFMPNNTPEEKYKKFEARPMHSRSIEKYINPFKPHWQSRYYSCLFGINLDTNGEQKRDVCINYLEGLEWTMKYYTTGCPDWRWRYKYNYPPLLTDLIHYIPLFDTTFIENKDKNPVSDIVQLCYVLPRESLNLLPMRFNLELLKNKSDWYDSNCEFTWAYCRYFWESHVDMNEIDISELESFVRKNRHLLM
jgi:5'-3' exonuclease